MLSEEQKNAFAFEIAKEIMKKEASRFADDPARLAIIMESAYDQAKKALKQKEDKYSMDFGVAEIMNNAALPDEFDNASRFK